MKRKTIKNMKSQKNIHNYKNSCKIKGWTNRKTQKKKLQKLRESL